MSGKDKTSGGSSAAPSNNKKRRASDSSNPALSKNIMQLKFMQRKMEAELRKQKEEEQSRVYDEAHWVLGGDSSEYLVEEAVDVSESVSRRSFKNFNPAVEKMNRSAEKPPVKASQKEKTNIDEGAEVTAQEMVSRYEKYVKGGIKGNSNSNSNNNNNSNNSQTSQAASAQNKRTKRDY
eukprot:TRINITY_DN1804_c0_g2_i1.p1 TRINITY_DN1804_c0_g2~~TRINITY_DN1804_c0_g2_i1.p1  ORF type:complete len:179 (+),score=62.57 TRINITY_DN1804_c0_g2_i1:135-671(+)